MAESAREQALAALRAIRGPLRQAHHDLSNPLAIISGNLQLVKEVAAMEGGSSMLLESLADAMAAVEQFSGPMDQLSEVRGRLDDAIKGLESSD